jgi:hypothetical protein
MRVTQSSNETAGDRSREVINARENLAGHRAPTPLANVPHLGQDERHTVKL